MSITNQSRKLDAGELVELFVLDMTVIDPALPILYFHPYATKSDKPIVFQGKTYVPLPVKMSGFESKLSGSPGRPMIQISDVTAVLSDLIASERDLVNAVLIRKLTYSNYLDDGPNADPLAEYPSARYRVERKTLDLPGLFVEFELSAFDFDGVKLPRRVVQPNTCSWMYRGDDCGFSGPGVDADNRMAGDWTATLSEVSGTFVKGETVTVTSPAFSGTILAVNPTEIKIAATSGVPTNGQVLHGVTSLATGTLSNAQTWNGVDMCGKNPISCRARHGRLGNALRFGGFPGTLRMMKVS